MRGVTDKFKKLASTIKISTHTPHARRDAGTKEGMEGLLSISTHTPHARRDRFSAFQLAEKLEFQLTRLMRGVTRGKH